MNMTKEKSDFVYPISPAEGCWEQELGITKREHFASLAMQGLLSITSLHDHDCDVIAKHAVNQADSLIKELLKTETSL